VGQGREFRRVLCRTPIPTGKTLVEVTIEPRDVDKDYPIDLAVIGDAKLVLRQLIDEVQRLGRPGRHDVTAEIRSVKDAYWREWRSEERRVGKEGRCR